MHSRLTFVLLAMLFHALVPAAAHAQSAAPAAGIEALRIEVQRLKADVEVMKKHIGTIAQFLQQREGIAQIASPDRAAPVPGGGSAPLNLEGAPVLGRADAPVTMIEFSDFECPFCQRYSSSVFPEIKREYIDTGKLRYVFMDFPLEQIHPNSRRAAEAAYCAGQQSAFWPMHDRLFANQNELGAVQLLGHARQLGLNAEAFERCLATGQHAAWINRGLSAGASVGVTATPTFLLARTGSKDGLNGATRVIGAQPV